MADPQQPHAESNGTKHAVFALVPPEIESPVYIPPGAIKKFDSSGEIPLKQPEQSEFSIAWQKADTLLTQKGFSPSERERICILLDEASPHRLFAHGPEAKEVASILASFLSPKRLLALLRQAEKARRLRPRTADALEAAYRKHNPALTIAAMIQRELGLILLAPEVRIPNPGRPNFFMIALVADAVADELKKRSERRVWPTVAELIEPFIKRVNPPVCSDHEHLRKLVVRHKHQARRKVATGQSSESWRDSKALLHQSLT